MHIEHAKTRTILGFFEQISAIPRGSRNEAEICAWLQAWAKQHGFASRTDEVSNLVIEVPASPGLEGAPTVVLQGHLDMVCEKAKGSTHDFTKDPIEHVYEGEWLRANQTTLGADNGIAIAMAMTAATESDVPHPPLELLFTIDEETGLTGANALKPGFIAGKILLNIDSEDEGVLTVGCAGGRDTDLELPLTRVAAPAGHEAYHLVVSGLRGGHSGVDIHKQRGNALGLLARTLDQLLGETDLRIASLEGGSAHNVIPRDAEAIVFVPTDSVAACAAAVERVAAVAGQELSKTDPKAKLTFAATGFDGPAWDADCSRRAVDLLLALPRGVAAYSQDIEGLVETSNNLATARTQEDRFRVLTSQRSTVMSKLHQLTHRIEAVGRLVGAEAASDEGYPAWQPNMNSALLARCQGVYRGLFDEEPVVEVIHAGLECGIIGAVSPGMDMISFGPTIEDPHSPQERIHVGTIGLVWDFLAALLKDLGA